MSLQLSLRSSTPVCKAPQAPRFTSACFSIVVWLLSVLLASSLAAASAESRDQLVDSGWRFFRGDAAGAENAGFDDSAWRTLDLPHYWSIEDIPGAPAYKENWSAPVSMWEQTTDAPEKVGPFDSNSVTADSHLRRSACWVWV